MYARRVPSDDRRRAAEDYQLALRLLARQTAHLRAAQIPSEPTDTGDPPTWTDDQWELVWGTALAWAAYASAAWTWRQLTAAPARPR